MQTMMKEWLMFFPNSYTNSNTPTSQRNISKERQLSINFSTLTGETTVVVPAINVSLAVTKSRHSHRSAVVELGSFTTGSDFDVQIRNARCSRKENGQRMARSRQRFEQAIMVMSADPDTVCLWLEHLASQQRNKQSINQVWRRWRKIHEDITASLLCPHAWIKRAHMHTKHYLCTHQIHARTGHNQPISKEARVSENVDNEKCHGVNESIWAERNQHAGWQFVCACNLSPLSFANICQLHANLSVMWCCCGAMSPCGAALQPG